MNVKTTTHTFISPVLPCGDCKWNPPEMTKFFLPLIDSLLFVLFCLSEARKQSGAPWGEERGELSTISPTTAAASCDATLVPNGGASHLTATRTAFRAIAENAIEALACMRGSKGD